MNVTLLISRRVVIPARIFPPPIRGATSCRFLAARLISAKATVQAPPGSKPAPAAFLAEYDKLQALNDKVTAIEQRDGIPALFDQLRGMRERLQEEIKTNFSGFYFDEYSRSFVPIPPQPQPAPPPASK